MRLIKSIAKPMTFDTSGSVQCILMLLGISLIAPAYALQGKEWDALKPEFVKTCKKSAAANIPSPAKLKEFCSCYAKEVVAGFTEEDVVVIMTDKGDATHAEQVVSQANADCTMRQGKKSSTEQDTDRLL
ncbi:hypothetical protein [Denitratisoma sp. DHT3]|uniref:hypothetical protein n=1 Tax=Denitratisoma sp. DHT3 TaxID=1981880 RepID=UPI0011A5A051|nr:hypothetical protein [Denitratisoma sp. DHT3]